MVLRYQVVSRETRVSREYLNHRQKDFEKVINQFLLSGDMLYKRNFDMVLLRCMDIHKAYLLIKEIHEGFFGIHENGHAMAKKIFRASYYWLTMETDCYHYAKTCHKCQIYADKAHVPPTHLNVLTAP